MIEHTKELTESYGRLTWIRHHIGLGVVNHAADAFIYTQVIHESFKVPRYILTEKRFARTYRTTDQTAPGPNPRDQRCTDPADQTGATKPNDQ